MSIRNVLITILLAALGLSLSACMTGRWNRMTNEDPWSDAVTQSASAPEPLESRDLKPGMTMNQVRILWGEPAQIDTAGVGGSGNARWVYSRGFIANPVLNGERRTVFFENGRVAGWDTGG